MKKELIIKCEESIIDFALLNEGRLIELNKNIDKNQVGVGDIFYAKIKKVSSSLNAAFVNLNLDKLGFLHYYDLGPKALSHLIFFKQVRLGAIKDYSLANVILKDDISKDGSVTDVLKTGQPILTQVVKEPISTKGPRVSTELSFAGRYTILVPFSDKISISSKIKDVEERKRLKRLVLTVKPKGFGVIIRTVAKNVKVAQLDNDLASLYNAWKRMCEHIAQNDAIPNKILSDSNRYLSILRDSLDESFSGIYVDNKDLYSEIKEYIKSILPERESIVKYYNKPIPIFDHFKVDRQIKSAFGKFISLKKGAYLVIEHTEALHVIDVNSGNRTKTSNQEENALEVNLGAATEIARQLRLRDMGGIIVVDFIDMGVRENREKLFEHLKTEMNDDRAKHKILPPSRFGLIQITRQRVRQETVISTKEKNPSIAEEVDAPITLTTKIDNELRKFKSKRVFIHTHPFVAAFLTKGLFTSIRKKWASKHKKKITIIPRDSFAYLEYTLKDKP